MTGEVSLENVIRTAIESYLLEVHTSIPCIVQKVNSDSVEVGIVTKKTKTDGTEFEVPSIVSVPVAYLGSADFSFSFPIKAGDEGIIIFGEREISSFLKSGKISSPSILRTHDYSDAVFLPSSLSSGKRGSISNDGLQIEDNLNGYLVSLDSAGITLTDSSGAGFTFLLDSSGVTIQDSSGASKIELTNSGVNLFGIIKFESVPGSGSADVTLNTHTHTNGNNGAPTGPPIIG